MKLLILLLTFANPTLKEDRIVINKSYDVGGQDFTVMIDNFYGSVEVVPSSDDKVHLDLEIVIYARTDELIEKAKEELELGERLVDDSLIFFTEAPFMERRSWGNYHGFDIRRKPRYSFRYKYKLRIPKSTGIYARTIDKGDVVIKNMDGIVKGCNVNGDVEIENARDVREASTVSGDITINFLENPVESVDFNTVNGDFNLEFPENFGAQIYFDSMNGELFTAFDYRKLSPKIEKSENGGMFKIGTKTGVQIGTGGPELSFRSINGNVYLKKSGAQ